MNKIKPGRPIKRFFKAARGRIGQMASKVKYIFSAFPSFGTFFVGISAVWSKPTYEKLATKGQRNPYAYTALNLIADNLASIARHLVVRVKDDKGEWQDVPDHPILKLLRRPSNDQSATDFFIELVHHLFYGGSLYMWNLGTLGRFEPTSVKLIRPDRVQQVKRDDQTLDIDWFGGVNMLGKRMQWMADDVCWIRVYNPLDDNQGWPLMAPVLQALDLWDNTLDWAGSIAQHKGRVPGFFTSEEEYDDTQYKRLQERIINVWQQRSGESQPMLLEGGMGWKEAGIDPQHGQMKESMLAIVRMIAVGMGIDPALLGDNANKTYSNYREAVRALIQLKVLPLLDWILAEMTNWYMPKYETPAAVLTYDESAIKQLQEDAGEKIKRLAEAVAGSIITPDEARQEMDKDAKGGNADVLLSKVGVVPLEEIGAGGLNLEDPEDVAAADALMDEVAKLLSQNRGANGTSNRRSSSNVAPA